MDNYSELLSSKNGVVTLRDFEGRKVIGKGADGSVIQLTEDRCIKIFEKEQTKNLELEAFQVGQQSSIIPRLYEHGKNFIVMEYISGISLPQLLKKEKRISEVVVRKILYMLEEMKRIGFLRCDTEVRHILFNENMDIKVIDLKRAFGSSRSIPTKLLKGIAKKADLKEFMGHLNDIDPGLYREWTRALK
ncbi:AarF/UbiB family protein [Sporosarcina highlanderae]|uniref:AarF/UbiB family protein n=1 Tax=Sporosarcina highlanderae TaxID=3035916 RepID=A0ABT8JV08_9BACL|nr:AarF/UbiB family protein [Sporosarcina highlanderae]MDN4609010.1 AarF/UbiB family protein [Sporosarcina highlanderae]